MRAPGKYLVAMIWWIILLFLPYLLTCSPIRYASSHLVYLVPIVLTLAAAAVLNFLEIDTEFWSRRGRWGRYVILVIAYTCVIGASLVLTVVLNSCGAVAFYGGDAGGSFALLYIPSILFYWIAGAIFCRMTRKQ
jgi:hypothetical protein